MIIYVLRAHLTIEAHWEFVPLCTVVQRGFKEDILISILFHS